MIPVLRPINYCASDVLLMKLHILLQVSLFFLFQCFALFWLKPGRTSFCYSLRSWYCFAIFCLRQGRLKPVIRYAHSQQSCSWLVGESISWNRRFIVGMIVCVSEPSVPRVCVRVTADSGIITPFRGLYSLGGISK